MSKEKAIEVSIQKLAGTYLKDLIQIFLCTVDSVNLPERQCDCTPIGSDSTTKLPGVLLCAENNNGLVVSPKVGSTVIVALSTKNTPFILMYSDIDSVQFMDGSYGGMCKTVELQTQINALNAQLQAVLTAITTWTPVPGDGGAALKAAAIAELAGKPAGNFTNIINPLITHGK